jgi:Tn3 transposase DDE domain
VLYHSVGSRGAGGAPWTSIRARGFDNPERVRRGKLLGHGTLLVNHRLVADQPAPVLPPPERPDRTLLEYSRLVKTIFILRYLESEQFRRRISGSSNHVRCYSQAKQIANEIRADKGLGAVLCL